jgi:hypothetical protein
MVFSDTTTKDGLIQDCEIKVFGSYGSITGNQNRLYEFTNRINRAYDKATLFTIDSDNRWPFETQTTTFDLVSGQREYLIDTTYLKILKIYILDQDGNKREIQPLAISDPENRQYEETLATPVTGLPISYDKRGLSLLLNPPPNYAKTDGLIIVSQTIPSYFASTDTTKSSDLPAVLDFYLSLDASTNYAIDHQLPNKNDLIKQLADMTDQLQILMASRARDEQPHMRARNTNSR